jgi:hypothetical protein
MCTYRLASFRGRTQGAPHDPDIGHATWRRDAPDFIVIGMKRHILQAWHPGLSTRCAGMWSIPSHNMQFVCDCQPPCLSSVISAFCLRIHVALYRHCNLLQPCRYPAVVDEEVMYGYAGLAGWLRCTHRSPCSLHSWHDK